MTSRVLPWGQTMKVSSMNLSHSLGCLSAVTSVICSKSSMKSPATTGERGDLIAVPSVCSKKWSLCLKYVDLRQSSVREHTCCGVMAVLSLKDSSCSSLSLMMPRASCTGTWVKGFSHQNSQGSHCCQSSLMISFQQSVQSSSQRNWSLQRVVSGFSRAPWQDHRLGNQWCRQWVEVARLPYRSMVYPRSIRQTCNFDQIPMIVR